MATSWLRWCRQGEQSGRITPLVCARQLHGVLQVLRLVELDIDVDVIWEAPVKSYAFCSGERVPPCTVRAWNASLYLSTMDMNGSRAKSVR
jgi:hypothetical protein